MEEIREARADERDTDEGRRAQECKCPVLHLPLSTRVTARESAKDLCANFFPISAPISEVATPRGMILAMIRFMRPATWVARLRASACSPSAAQRSADI